MLGDWQTWVALSVVAIAGAYVARRAFIAWRGEKAKSCGGCTGCGESTGKQLPIVELNGAAYSETERPE